MAKENTCLGRHWILPQNSLTFLRKKPYEQLYQKILKKNLPPKCAPDCPRELKKKWYVIQDNARTHKTSDSMKKLRELSENRLYEHPAYSPDFNVAGRGRVVIS